MPLKQRNWTKFAIQKIFFSKLQENNFQEKISWNKNFSKKKNCFSANFLKIGRIFKEIRSKKILLN